MADNLQTFCLVNFANYNQRCADASLTPFIQYLGFFLLLQGLLVILIEKILIKIPRISGKIERFYGIIEEALYGKDPDVIEDITDWKANPDAISRQRRKNEICIGLKRSSVISKTFRYKNLAEIFLLGMFIVFNIIYGIDSEQNLQPGICILNVKEIPNLGLKEDGFIYFDCEGKRVGFYLKLLYIQIATQFLVLICCVGSLIWSIFFRSVSQLLEKIEGNKIDWDVELEKNEGEDFLFLFDLLAHTSGIEATLRVLTHADETFRKICLPKLTVADQLKVEEEKLKVYWKPASLEVWLEKHDHKGIKVESYDVTIFPRESINTSVTKMKDDKDSEGNYSAWFYDLQGGRTEYIVTIACVIGRSRMKGEQVVTMLLPYGPERPRGGLVKSVSKEEVEICWEAPKGGFTKYVLCVDPELTSSGARSEGREMTKFYCNTEGHIGSYISFDKIVQDYTERELSNMITNYKVSGLKPGETYGVVLKTMSGGRYTRRPLSETLLTQPSQVEDLRVEDVTSSQATLKWVVPEGHRRLRAFRLLVSSSDGEVSRELAVRLLPDKMINSFPLDGLNPATTFQASVKTVCVFENLRTISDEKCVSFVSLPEAVRRVALESSSPSSLTVSWEPSQQPPAQSQKFKLSVENSRLGYCSEYSVTGERNTFNFSKLPDVVGSGEEYVVKVYHVVLPVGADREVTSSPAVERFTTKPLPPRDLRIEENKMVFSRSLTASVSGYKVKYRSAEEGSRAEEFLVSVDVDQRDVNTVTVDIQNLLSPDVLYKLNLISLVLDINKLPVESRPLHEKVIKTEGMLTLYKEDSDKERRQSVVGCSSSPGMSRQVSRSIPH